ncbi:MAG: hypothetical protein ACMZ66_05480 [Thalassospira sp.]|uniref:hypothetical protein n=1 Tax=Thalassospira sp. TaxID=1912094 RepID=UPI003A88E1A8
MNQISPDERQAFADAFAAQRKYSKNRQGALDARKRKDTRAMGKYRAKCAESLLEELAATNAAGIVGKADPDYVHAKRGEAQ